MLHVYVKYCLLFHITYLSRNTEVRELGFELSLTISEEATLQ